jgi:hypothetical protein
MEQIVKLLGRIAEVMPAQEGVSARTGNAWKSQEYLFEYFAWSGAQYPSRILARIFGEDNIAKFNLKQGEEVTVWLRFDANKSQDGTRWFNEIRITNVERAGVQANQPTAANQAAQGANAPAAVQQPTPPFPEPQNPSNQANDDLPF